MRKIRYKNISPEMKKLSEPNFIDTGRSSLGLEQFMGEYFFIDIKRLVPYKHQARKIFNEVEIQKLSETILEHGILQPLNVLRSAEEEGVFEVVSGERRLRAATLAGLRKVPCIIIEDAKQAAEIALIENIQRENLHPIELARAVSKLILSAGEKNNSEIARRIGLSRSQLSETLKILEIEENILEKVLEHDVRGREHFRKLLSLGSEKERNQYLVKILKEKNGQTIKKSLVTRSVLRISVGEKGLKVQKNQLENLTNQQLQKLIKMLEEIVREWKE